MKDCLIFAAGEYPDEVCRFHDFLTEEDWEKERPFIIACDKGYEFANSLGYTPDLAIGDFDSLGYVPNNVEVRVHPKEKNETDLELAIACGLAEGCDYFTVYGALGGRLDHSIANINLAVRLVNQDKNCVLIGKNESATVIKDGRVNFFGEKGTRFSVFPLDGDAEGVIIIGGKYPLKTAPIEKNQIFGVSNEINDFKEVKVIVSEGTLLVIMAITNPDDIIAETGNNDV